MNEKKSKWREGLSWLLACFTMTLLFIVGMVTATLTHTQEHWQWLTAWGGSVILLTVIGLLSFVGAKLYAKGMNQKKYAEMRDYMMAQKGRADADASAIVGRIRRVHFLLGCFYGLYLLLLFAWAFCLGAVWDIVGDFGIFVLLVPIALLKVVYSRLFELAKKPDFSGYTKREDYPELYRIAHSAAEAVGVELKGEIRIALLHDCNAGICRMGRDISLQLGTQLLSVLHPEELYQILLHEFAHLNSETEVYRFGVSFAFRFANCGMGTLEDKLVDWMLFLPGVVSAFEYETCRMAASESWERVADAIILEKGDPSMAVSALCKTAMGDLFERELGDFVPNFYISEEIPQAANSTICAAFKRAIEERGEFWQSLMEKQLPYQIGSHPIFRQRREALGNPAYTVTFPTGVGAFAADVEKARQQIDREAAENLKDSYADRRRVNYLEPLARVEKFEASNGRLTAPEIPDILSAYGCLDRYEEQEALCDRLLADPELSEYETVAARYVKGCLRLSNYDPAGIEMIYRVVELNYTYMEGGFEQISQFCHWMGLEKEMIAHRERVLSQMQEKRDVYDQAGDLSASDRLVAEDFNGDGRLPAMLDYMVEAGDGKLLEIFLVRKMITADYFCSTFVLRFDFGLSDDEKDEVYDKIYHYLDNYPMDWHYALFVYDKEIAKAVKKVEGSCVYHKD